MGSLLAWNINQVSSFFHCIRQIWVNSIDSSSKLYFWYGVKVGSHLPNNFIFICCNESPIYFLLKVLFVLDIFNFLSWLFNCEEIQLNKGAKVNFKIYEVTDWTTKNYNIYIYMDIYIYLLSNISKSNGHWKRKFGQLIEYNMTNIFLEN